MVEQKWKRPKKKTASKKVAMPTVLSTLSDNELISRYLVVGDEQSFGVLYVRYRMRVINFLYRKIGNRDVAEDLFQETFIRVYRNLDRFDSKHKFSTWVYTIASNLAKNELRNRQRSIVSNFSDLPNVTSFEGDRGEAFPDVFQNPHRDFEKARTTQLLAYAVDTLSPDKKQVFVLRELRGYTYDEIAREAGILEGTVKSRLNRARVLVGKSVRNQGYD